MDRLYELGKRFDRLLYMSIIVVISSFLSCSLLITLSSQNLFALISSYKDIKHQIEIKKAKSISLKIKSLQLMKMCQKY